MKEFAITYAKLNVAAEATSSMPLSSVEPTYSPQRELTDSTATAQVVHVVSPVDFYCQLKESFDQLDALSSQLIAVYSGERLISFRKLAYFESLRKLLQLNSDLYRTNF